MHFSSMHAFIEALRKRLHDKKPVEIHFDENNDPSWFESRSASSYDLQESANQFLEYLAKRIFYLEFEILPEEEFEAMREMFDICEEYLEIALGKDNESHEAKKMRAWMQSIRVGGNIPTDYLLDESLPDVAFFKANALDKKFSAIGLELRYDREKGIIFPFVIRRSEIRYVALKDLKKIKLDNGIVRYMHNSQHCMDLNAGFELQQSFEVLGKGICHYKEGQKRFGYPTYYRSAHESSDFNAIEIFLDSEKQNYFVRLRHYNQQIYEFAVEKGQMQSPSRHIYESQLKNHFKKYTLSSSAKEIEILIKKIDAAEGKISENALLAMIHEHGALEDLPLRPYFSLENLIFFPKALWEYRKKHPNTSLSELCFSWNLKELDFVALETLYQQSKEVQDGNRS